MLETTDSKIARRVDTGRLAAMGLLAALAVASAAASADIEGSRDHPVLSRYAGSEIVAYDFRNFDEYALLTEAAQHYGGKEKNLDFTQPLEGKVTRISYRAPPERTTLEVFRNYQTALTGAGFEELFSCKDTACGGRNFNHAVVPYDLSFGDYYADQRYLAATLQRAEGDLYVSLYLVLNRAGGGPNAGRVMTQLDIVELASMESEMVTVDASAMAKEILERGRVALYGIFFDTAKASLKPASAPTLEEIAKLMKADPELRLVVVGHTDNVGKFDYNMDLSKRRAAAVEKTLTNQYGIGQARLSSWGVGYLSPVASNQSDEGRALNRRVELVER